MGLPLATSKLWDLSTSYLSKTHFLSLLVNTAVSLGLLREAEDIAQWKEHLSRYTGPTLIPRNTKQDRIAMNLNYL